MRDDGRPLWSLSATELSRAYADGVSPVEVITATLAHIRNVNPKFNAIVTLDEAGATRAAEASARRWTDSRPASPLDGVPAMVKDNILVAGLRATWGSRLYRDYIPDQDELPVQRLREAGAVIFGKTNVPEFTVHGFTDNALFGVTGNPWNPELTPGGSSGGAVAGVASGMSAIALGTDGGGSIRRPAAHTGLVGFKPSRDMVPRGKGFPAILLDFEVVGPIARGVDDIITSMEIISGANWSRSKRETGVNRPRIAFAPDFEDAPIDPFIRHVVGQTIARAKSLGLDVETIARFELATPLGRIWPVISQTGIAWLLDGYPERKGEVSPAIAEMALAGDAWTARDYLNALNEISAMGRSFDAFFERYDFLITPTTAAMPWPARESHPSTIDGKAVSPRGHAVFTPFANALGLPAISVPCRIEGDALPVGLQIVASRGSDWALLAFAREYEDRLFPHSWPPGLKIGDERPR
jgi:aspartyl-tRNA(Asn)/glutamyl-tRNA(Gln) amidotransferase subunit A